MAKQWIVGGIWAILMSAGVLMCGWRAAAEHPREMPNTVQKVTFLGAKHIKEEELRNLTGVRKGMILNPNLNRQGCQRILGKYEEMGRTFADCQLLKGGDLADTEVVYQITEGPKVNVRDIQFTGNTFVTGARLATQVKSSSEWFSLIGGTYYKLMAEADKQELEKYYRRFGYQDVRVSLETQRSADGGSLTLIYHIHEGRRYRIQDVPDGQGTAITPREQLVALSSFKPGDDGSRVIQTINLRGVEVQVAVVETQIGKIRVTGNKRISSESILAHVPLVPGNVLSYADLQQAEQNLAELGLFVVDAATGVRPTVTVVDAESDIDRKDLLITVKEKAKATGKKSEQPR